MSPLIYATLFISTLSISCGLDGIDLAPENGNENQTKLDLPSNYGLERMGDVNNSLQLGDFTLPIVLDVSLKGQQNESRIFKVNCKPQVGQPIQQFVTFEQPTPFLQRSVCEFSVQEAMAIIGFLFMLLTLIVAGLFLCCASGRDETIPVAIIPKATENSSGICPSRRNEEQQPGYPFSRQSNGSFYGNGVNNMSTRLSNNNY